MGITTVNKMIKALQTFLPVPTIMLSLAGVIYLQTQTLSSRTQTAAETYVAEAKNDQFFLDTQVRMPTLGFGNLLADWTYLQFIQYFGDVKARDITGHGLIPQFFKIIVDDDPRFVQAFLIMSSANTLYAFSPKTTVDLLNKVISHINPRLSYLTPYIWSYKGVDEMLFLGDNKAAQHSYEMAAKWALEQGGKDAQAVAKRNSETAVFLAKNPDSKKARVTAWMSIMENALDDNMRGQAIREIEALGGKVEIAPDGNLLIIFPEQD
jgi:hypothetical protein